MEEGRETGLRVNAGWARTVGEPLGVEVRQRRAGAVQQLEPDLCGRTRDCAARGDGCTWSEKDQGEVLALGGGGVAWAHMAGTSLWDAGADVDSHSPSASTSARHTAVKE